jgi:hypothetical protein
MGRGPADSQSLLHVETGIRNEDRNLSPALLPFHAGVCNIMLQRMGQSGRGWSR